MKALLLNTHVIFSPDIKAAFEQLGWQAVIFDAVSREHLNDQVQVYRPDLIMTLGAPDYYSSRPYIAQYLGARGLQPGYQYMHWDTDGILGAYSHTMPFVRISRPDMTFTVCNETLELLYREGFRAGIMRYGINPMRFNGRTTDLQYTGKITYIARVYDWVMQDRKLCKTQAIDTLVGAVVKNRYRLDLWGDPAIASLYQRWHGIAATNIYHGYCEYEALDQIYRSCYMNLVPQNGVWHVTKRTYDILGAGGFALSYDTPGVREEFEDGSEIVTVNREHEVIDYIIYFSNHLDEYHQIRMNAYNKVHTHYTYTQRLGGALREMGI